ncbi:MAG: hypothetical protein H6818_04850 [Phycisphaerales bacterium]|nr:hypothetical protein [Phycisphaerales bacterium]
MVFDPEALPTPDLGLRCMKCGYPLAGLSERRCPTCGSPFEYESFVPKGDYPAVIVDGKEALLTPDVQDALRRAKIPYMEIAEETAGLYGMHSVTQSKSRVGVPRSLYFDAVLILRQLHVGELEFPPEAVAADWTCPSCDEENPGTFEICWQCGAQRQDDAPNAD